MIEWLKQNFIFIGIAFLVAIFLFFTKDDNDSSELETVSTDPVIEETDTEDEEITNDDVLVDIKGEINKPGVYELVNDARVNDVIDLAGGFTKKANESDINLAQKVHDEMIIIVPSSETNTESNPSNPSNPTNSTTENKAEKIRINIASQDEVETLSGIGPSKAQTIIEYREENGLFKSVEDLLNISGIGEKTLENIKDDIQIP